MWLGILWLFRKVQISRKARSVSVAAVCWDFLGLVVVVRRPPHCVDSRSRSLDHFRSNFEAHSELYPSPKREKVPTCGLNAILFILAFVPHKVEKIEENTSRRLQNCWFLNSLPSLVVSLDLWQTWRRPLRAGVWKQIRCSVFRGIPCNGTGVSHSHLTFQGRCLFDIWNGTVKWVSYLVLVGQFNCGSECSVRFLLLWREKFSCPKRWSAALVLAYFFRRAMPPHEGRHLTTLHRGTISTDWPKNTCIMSNILAWENKKPTVASRWLGAG